MRILVVEDDKHIRDFLKTSLSEEAFAVDTAEDGEKGSRLARTNDYDLIVLDNRLPKKNGLEVCKEIRADGKAVPILMLSVMSGSEKKVELLNAGADDYLSKPFKLEELLARIRALLRRPAQIENEILQVDGIVLDTKQQVVTREGKEIHLTRKEFALLHYLMKNKGTVLSRGMILEHVWDMNADPFSNTIESHINSLRHKLSLGDEPSTGFIHTVSGRGYKINDPKT